MRAKASNDNEDDNCIMTVVSRSASRQLMFAR
jgi:hypothetical protein